MVDTRQILVSGEVPNIFRKYAKRASPPVCVTSRGVIPQINLKIIKLEVEKFGCYCKFHLYF